MKCIVLLNWWPMTLSTDWLTISPDEATVFAAVGQAEAAIRRTATRATPESVYRRGQYNIVRLTRELP